MANTPCGRALDRAVHLVVKEQNNDLERALPQPLRIMEKTVHALGLLWTFVTALSYHALQVRKVWIY